MKRKKIVKSEVKKVDQSEQKLSEEPSKFKESPSRNLAQQIGNAAQGLYYTSESEAGITPFVGTTAEKVDRDEIIRQTKTAADTKVKEKSFSDFFVRLTTIQDWFEDEEKETAQKFVVLRETLENNIRDLKVFKLGTVELDIYVVGLDSENTFLGIKTKAVETGD